jgi:hypothetical protein
VEFQTVAWTGKRSNLYSKRNANYAHLVFQHYDIGSECPGYLGGRRSEFERSKLAQMGR